jgi:hypothetical protein
MIQKKSKLNKDCFFLFLYFFTKEFVMNSLKRKSLSKKKVINLIISIGHDTLLLFSLL